MCNIEKSAAANANNPYKEVINFIKETDNQETSDKRKRSLQRIDMELRGDFKMTA